MPQDKYMSRGLSRDVKIIRMRLSAGPWSEETILSSTSTTDSSACGGLVCRDSRAQDTLIHFSILTPVV